MDLLRFYYTQNPTPMEDEDLFDAYTRAASWATNTQYDLRKANSAARFFHDTRMSDSDISEFCSNIETKLNELGITIIQTDYDIF